MLHYALMEQGPKTDKLLMKSAKDLVCLRCRPKTWFNKLKSINSWPSNSIYRELKFLFSNRFVYTVNLQMAILRHMILINNKITLLHVNIRTVLRYCLKVSIYFRFLFYKYKSHFISGQDNNICRREFATINDIIQSIDVCIIWLWFKWFF